MTKEYSKMENGVVIYLVIVMISILLSISLGLTAILFQQIKILRGIESSVKAFYAADTGIELILFYRNDPDTYCTGPPVPCLCGSINPCSLNGAKYYVIILEDGEGDCSTDNYCITSIGTYGETRRAVEIQY